MIKLELKDLRDIDCFSPSLAVERLNKIIEERWNDLKDKGVTIVCNSHFPSDSGRYELNKSDKSVTHWTYWYDQTCGACGLNIYPSSWETFP